MANTDVLPGESIGLMRDYEYQPYSFLDSPELVEVHGRTMATCADMDDVATVRWLDSLAGYAAASGRRDYEVLSDNSPQTSVVPSDAERRLRKTGALVLYTAAKAEHLLRIQSVRDSEDVDRGVSRIVSSSLAKLSNVYRIRVEERPTDAVAMLPVAHSLAMYALRFKEPDHVGYRQSLGHWLHLSVDVDIPWRITPEKLAEWEAVLRLAISLEELGAGPQDSYANNSLVPDLAKVFELAGQEEQKQQLVGHFANIPAVDGEPELWFRKARTS